MAYDAQEGHPAERIERLLQEVEAFPDPHLRAVAQELLQAVVALYGEGLERIFELIARTEGLGQPPAGLRLIELLAGDELIGGLLLLHDLHPLGLEERIARALVALRPTLRAHGGDVTLLRVEEGVAHLRLEGSCHGCQASARTLVQTIEEALYRAVPDLQGLEVEGVNAPPRPTAVPVVFMPRRRSVRGVERAAGPAEMR
jgi:Fe-S cluster biogenesis protein NfuA